MNYTQIKSGFFDDPDWFKNGMNQDHRTLYLFLACYKDMLSMGGGPMNHANENLPKAQALKDATMAKSIADNWQSGKMVIHYNGSYHSDRYMGIIWYLKKYSPSAKVATIATVLQDDIDKMSDEHKNTADYVIVIPTSMTRTYK